MQLTAWSIPPLFAMVLGALTYRRVAMKEVIPGVYAMRWLLIGITLWCLGQLLSTLVTDLDFKVWATVLEYLGILVTPVAWFGFAFNYANGERRSSITTVTLISFIPAITFALVLTNPMHHLIWRTAALVWTSDRSFVGLAVGRGPWSTIWGVYAYCLVFSGTVVLAYILGQSKRLRRPFFAVIAAPVIVGSLNLMHLSPWNPTPWVDLTPAGFLLAILIINHSVLGYGLLDVVAFIRHRVVEKLRDMVVVVDKHGAIIDINPSGQKHLRLSRKRSLLDPDSQIVHSLGLDNLIAGQSLQAEVTIDGRTYDVQSSHLDESDKKIGEISLVFRDITERREAERALQELKDQLELQANTDPLTGLPNRRHFMRRLTEESARVRRRGGTLSMLMIDLDFFKQVNDRYGHHIGDRLLEAVAHALESSKRISDVAARLGGEEFAVLLPDTDHAGVVQAAERLCRIVERCAVDDGNHRHVGTTVSIGVATLTQQNSDFEALLRRADKALYEAKGSGRNTVCYADAA